MSSSKLRRQIAWQAAMLMYHREESEYYQAKMKAARAVVKGWVKPSELPSNAEIRDHVQALARTIEGSARTDQLCQMRIAAVRLMRLLKNFHPRLIGSVLTGHVRSGSDIDIHLFADNVGAVTGMLEYYGLQYDLERKQIRKGDMTRTYKHVHVTEEFKFELTVYVERQRNEVMKSSITGKPIERASLAELEQFMAKEYPSLDLNRAVEELEEKVDPCTEFLTLLLPLEDVKQNPIYHPEGDALYHSLQVFDLAVDALPYDEEFLLAALLHDVGKGIDATDHVRSGVEVLQDLVSERTLWLVEHHMLAHQIQDRTLGARAHRRLRENESYHELVLLGECDRGGRKRGVPTTSLDDALKYISDLGRQ